MAGHKERRIGDHPFMAVVGVGSWVHAEMRRASEIKSPEFPRLGGEDRGPQWATVLQAAQVASSLALTVAYIHP